MSKHKTHVALKNGSHHAPEQVIAELTRASGGATERFAGGGGDTIGSGQQDGGYKGAQGLDPEFIAELEAQGAPAAEVIRTARLRYEGSEQALEVTLDEAGAMAAAFEGPMPGSVLRASNVFGNRPP